MIDYAELKPFGFIPGEYEVVCKGCNQKWALMAATATHCKRCARNALKKASSVIDRDETHEEHCFLAMGGGGLCTCGKGTN